jgi:hypothetical protein
MAGYCDYSKSNNAVDAENEGRYPLTKAARIVAKYTDISIKEARSILENIGTVEYHHSSKFYNTVNYYDTTEPIRVINHMNRFDLKTYQAASDDLERIEYETYERDTEADLSIKAGCVHNFIEVSRDRKKVDGGGRVFSHRRCEVCGMIKLGEG